MVDLQGKRVLVTGATGFIGSALIPKLVAAGAEVMGLSRNPPSDSVYAWKMVEIPGHGGWWWRPFDLGADNAPMSLLDLVTNVFSPNYIVHLTSDSQGGRELDLVEPSVKNDVLATINMLIAAAEYGKLERFVMTASLEEPNNTQPVEYVTPISPYAAAKFTTGVYARMFRQLYKVPVVRLRPFMAYGPRQKPHKLIPSTITSFLQGKEVVVGSPARRLDWVYVDDVADAFVKALGVDADVDIDVGTGRDVSLFGLVGTIAVLMGKGIDDYTFGDNNRGKEIERCADLVAAKELLDWEPTTSLVDGLRQTIEWYKENAQ